MFKWYLTPLFLCISSTLLDCYILIDKVWQLVQINVLAELARIMSKSDVLQFYSPNKYLIILTQLAH